MTYFVCDLLDLEGHARAVVGGDRDSNDLIQAALNDYEKQGMTLQHVVPGEYVTQPHTDRSNLPKFVFHKQDEPESQARQPR